MAKVRGENVYVSVNISGTYTKVGGQLGLSMNLGQTPRNVTDKDSVGWEQNELGNRTAGVDFNDFLIEDNAAWLELKKGLINGAGNHQKVDAQVDTPAYKYTGIFIMSSLNFTGPFDNMSDISFSLINDGILTEVQK